MNDTELQTITGNPFISVPGRFTVHKKPDGGVRIHSVHYDSTPQSSPDNYHNGATVTNPRVPGASAIVIPMEGKAADSSKTGRLLLQVSGQHRPQYNYTWDFTSAKPTGGTPSGLEHLHLLVQTGLAPSDEALSLSQSVTIPLLVGPSSLVIGQMPPQPHLSNVGIDFAKIIDTVGKVLPVVAGAGYDIYQELSASSLADEELPEGFFDTIGAIAKVAVPIAGTLLAAL